jgi:hypothetical protein
MEETNDAHSEQLNPENNPVTKNEVLSDESLLIKARCLEKTGHFTDALKIYILLKKEEDAIRCSTLEMQKNTEKNRHKHNKWPIYILTGSTFIMIILFMWALISFTNKQNNIIPPSVQWLNKGKVELNNYPNWFLYDQKNNQIETRATIDEKMKFELQKYYPEHDSLNFNYFRDAVDQLAFKSNNIGSSYYWLLLIVRGLAAIVGVLIREILDLIYHYCYQNDLDFRMWWPWYLLRPIVGFMVGVIIILFSGTNLLMSTPETQSETYLIALAIVAGIGVEDVMFKIRKISQVVFGDSSQNSSSGNSVTPKPDDGKKDKENEKEDPAKKTENVG